MSGRHWLSGLFALLVPLYRLYYRTLRVRALLADGSVIATGDYPYGRQIFALCERDAVALSGIMAGRGFSVLVSPGRDGDWATAALERIGCHAVRGSSRRGGARALAALIKELTAGTRPAGIVVDGPLGPSGTAKPGVLLLGSRSEREVIPLAAAARRALVIPISWSKIYLPLPFTRVAVVLGEALRIPPGSERAALDAGASELSARLAHARARAVGMATATEEPTASPGGAGGGAPPRSRAPA